MAVTLENVAASYGRVSTDEQEEKGYSLAAQLRLNREYAAKNGFTIPLDYEITDHMTGLTLDRPGLTRLRELAKSGQIKAVIIYEIDRLSRRYVHQIILREDIKASGVEIHYSKTGQKSADRAEDRIGEDVMALLAEIDREKILERTNRGKQQKLTEGKPIGGGKAPYGYHWEGTGKVKCLAIIEEEAKIVRLIFTWYNEGVSPAEIASRLTAMKVATPGDRNPLNPGGGNKKKWRGYGEWGRTTVYNLLRPETYAGVWVHNKHKIGEDKKLRKNYDTDSYQGVQVPPIIDRELWQAVQRKLDNGRAHSLRNATVAKDYLLARLIKCECKSAVHVTWSEGRVGERRLYYRCPGRLASYGHRCTKPWLRAELTDTLVWERLSQTVLDPIWIEEFMRGQNENAGTQQVEVDAQHEILLVQKLDIQKRLDRLTDMREGGELSREEYLMRRAQREVELKKLDEEIDRLEASVGVRYSEQEITDRVELMTKIKLGTLKANRAERRAIVEWLDLQVKYTTRDGQLGLEIYTMLTTKNPDFVSFDSQATLSALSL